MDRLVEIFNKQMDQLKLTAFFYFNLVAMSFAYSTNTNYLAIQFKKKNYRTIKHFVNFLMILSKKKY